MKRMLTGALLIVIALAASAASAQDAIEEMETDRPDQTESSSVVWAGRVQAEAGYFQEGDLRATDVAETRSVAFAYPSLLLRWGLLEWLELRLEGSYAQEGRHVSFGGVRDEALSDTARGFESGVGFKAHLLDEDGALPEMAVIGSVGFPLAFRSAVPGFRFCLSHTLSPALSLGYNLGGEMNLERETFIALYTASLGASIAGELGAYVELYGSFDPEDRPAHSFDGGFTYGIAPNVQLDMAAGLGLTDNAPDYILNAGLSVRMPR